MGVKLWQVCLPSGLGIVLAGLVVAFALGVLVEAIILVITVAACAGSVVPLLVDRSALRRADGPSAGNPAPARTGRQRI